MNIARHIVFAAGFIVLGSNCAQAAEATAAADQSVYVGFGAFGASVGYEKRFGDLPGRHWGTRLLVNTGGVRQRSWHEDRSGNYYDTRLKAGAGLSSLFDYYPCLDCGWRLTGGVILSRIKADLSGRPDSQGNYRFNDHVYNAAQVGTLTGQMKHAASLLYLGGGWESTPAGAKGWRFVSDAGVFVAGKAKATLASTNAAGNPALQADLHAESDRIDDRGLGILVQLGAAYAF